MADPETTDDLVTAAQQTVQDCKQRWDTFREDCGTQLDGYVDQSFGYFQSVLADDSSPSDWVKGGLALWIQSYGTSRGIWNAAYRLWFPSDGNG